MDLNAKISFETVDFFINLIRLNGFVGFKSGE